MAESRALKRILITGATGFVGTASLEPLRSRFPGALLGALVRSARAADGARGRGLEPVPGDLARPGDLGAALRRFSPDAVVHLAAEIATARDAAAIRATNVEGTRALAEAARELPELRCLLYASTLVTGDAGGRLLTEEGSLPVETEYGRSKLEGERILREAGLPLVILRPSHVYGPGGWFAQLLRDLRRGLFRIPGKGENWWDVVQVEDVASALALALAEAPAGSLFHVVDDEPVRMRDFFAEVARLAGRRPVGHAPLLLARLLRGRGAIAAAVRSARSSNARLKEQLGWRPRYPDYRAGLAATFAALAASR